MNWLSAFVPAERTAEPEAAPQRGAPQLPVAALPIERSTGKPRPKAPAIRPKLLPSWEAPSDDECPEDFMDDGTDDGREDEFVRGRNGQSGDRSPLSSGFDITDVSDAHLPSMAPLRSYEETVLKLKPPGFSPKKPRDAAQGELGDGSTAGTDESKGAGGSPVAQLKLQNELKMREKLLEEEKLQKCQDLQRDNSSALNSASAARIIVSVAKVKLNMMRQKMKLYDEAEYQGTEANLRARKLLTWVASLSFLKKFDEKMQLGEIERAKTDHYLTSLPLPPPPPPPEDPPDSEEEELHEKYEAMIRRYEGSWNKEGQRVLGKDKFEEVRNKRSGPAEKEKKIIAQKCLQRANEVLNEAEYQEFLRKAWRLGDDHAALTEYNAQEFARQAANTTPAKKTQTSL